MNYLNIKTIKNGLFSLLLMATTFAQADITTTYYINDALGSPIVEMDETGEVTWRKNYKPFGEEIEQGSDSANNRIGYTGHVHDRDIGLTYMQGRYYDPMVGRFMGMDPAAVNAEDPRTFNRYAYANNNPYKFIDPDGNWSTEAHNYFIDQFSQANGIGRNETASIKQGSKSADNFQYQFGDSAHMHAMGDGVNSSAAQRSKMNKFISAKISLYNSLLKKSKSGSVRGRGRNGSLKNKAYKELGYALHAAMDYTSPSHEGFQVWKWDKDTVYRHGDFSGSLENLNSAKSNGNTTKTLKVMNSVFSGKKLK